ncbi:quinone oxidoreductase family protein [Actinoallomurus sp. CA-142502]|uniref:quinone oxidoreductase family protein n=1 Tax=Actinoallomurus sp. CA-142502 TaxID=3239885 RepID=UPI003D8C9976
MLAAIVRTPGELAVVDAPVPVPAAHQVLIEVEAAGAGYVDVMALRGEYPTPLGTGATPGVEVVGRVTAVGPDTPAELVGDRVLAVLTAFGGFAEKAVADMEGIVPAPDDVGAPDLVATGVNALVAEIALRRAGVTEGERVLVLGAGGGIGVLATQIARAHGAEVTAVTSSAARGERLRTLGATRVVDRTRSALPDDDTYDVIVDTVAGPALGRHLRLLRPNGRHVLCGAAAGVPDPAAFASPLHDFHKSPTVLFFSLNSVAPRDRRQSWTRVLALMAEGRLSPVIDRCLPLAEADAALRRVADGTAFGKVVLVPR